MTMATDVTDRLRTDWRTIDENHYLAAQEFMTAIALQLGWRVEEFEIRGRLYYRALTPQGTVSDDGMSKIGAFENRYWLNSLPQYAYNLDDAWQLIPDMSTGIYFYLSNTGTPARCRSINSITGVELADELGKQPEFAVCKTWLATQDAMSTLVPADEDSAAAAK